MMYIIIQVHFLFVRTGPLPNILTPTGNPLPLTEACAPHPNLGTANSCSYRSPVKYRQYEESGKILPDIHRIVL
jgi:hypothetical protein